MRKLLLVSAALVLAGTVAHAADDFNVPLPRDFVWPSHAVTQEHAASGITVEQLRTTFPR